MLEPRKLLLLDGIGALISSVMLGGVLTYLRIGMPLHILYSLSIVALCFATFSILSFYQKSIDPKRLLKTIGTVNIIYCIVSVGLVIVYYNQLTTLGIGYFILEKTIVLPLAFIELKASQN